MTKLTAESLREDIRNRAMELLEQEERVVSELEQVRTERLRLERALEALGERRVKRGRKSLVKPRSVVGRKGSRRRDRGKVRAPRGERRKTMLALIKGNPGIRASNLAMLMDI